MRELHKAKQAENNNMRELFYPKVLSFNNDNNNNFYFRSTFAKQSYKGLYVVNMNSIKDK